MLSIADLARLANVSPALLHDLEILGLLAPDAVDEAGAPTYRVACLARLHRLLALRDLGFDVDEMGTLLEENLTLDAMRGMLRLRQAQVDRNVEEERARLRRVDNHLRAIERGVTTAGPTIVVRRVNALRIARAAGRAAGFGEALGPVIGQLLMIADAHLRRTGTRPGTCVAWFEEPAADGSVTLHAGFTVGAQPVPDSADVRVVNLPGTEVASALHHGPMDSVEPVYAAMLAWITERGYRRSGAGRELYLRWNDRDPAGNVTELQIPIDRARRPEQPWRRPVEGTASARMRAARRRVETFSPDRAAANLAPPGAQPESAAPPASPPPPPPPPPPAPPPVAPPPMPAPVAPSPPTAPTPAPSPAPTPRSPGGHSRLGRSPGALASGHLADGIAPNGIAPNSIAANGAANAIPAHGIAQNGMAPNGLAPNGAVAVGAVLGGEPAVGFGDGDRGTIDIRYPRGQPPGE